MKSSQIIIIYSFFICLFLTLAGIFTAKNASQLLSSFIYLPLIFYFGTKLIHFLKKPTTKSVPRRKIIRLPEADFSPQTSIEPEVVTGVPDNDKRLFLKLIGSTGFSLLLMALFTKKAQASFFGSAPLGPGVVAIKDSAGNKIDPAEKNPTDGYEITDIDDASSPAYYGFVKNTGAWYIMLEDSSGSYRYTKGTNNFATNWTNRATLTYDYFNSVFG